MGESPGDGNEHGITDLTAKVHVARERYKEWLKNRNARGPRAWYGDAQKRHAYLKAVRKNSQVPISQLATELNIDRQTLRDGVGRLTRYKYEDGGKKILAALFELLEKEEGTN